VLRSNPGQMTRSRAGAATSAFRHHKKSVATVVSRVGSRCLFTIHYVPSLLHSYRVASLWTQKQAGSIGTKLRRGLALSVTSTASKLRSQVAARPTPHTTSRGQALWIAGTTSAVAVALCGMFFWMAWHAREIVVAETYRASSNLALSVEQFVARTMETVDLSLRIAASEISAGAASMPGDVQTRLAEQVRHSPQITSIIIAGADGRVRFASDRVRSRAIDVSKKKYFTQATGSHAMRFVIEDPVVPRADGRRVIFAARRFDRLDGSFGGVITAAISADYVQRFLSTLHIGRNGIIALQTVDGTMLVRQPYQEGYVGKNFAATALFKEWLPWASSGVFPAHDEADGLWRIVGYQRVERLPLVVHVALSQDEALTHWRSTTLWQGGVGAMILAFSGLMAFGLHRQLQARMRAHAQLSDTIRELERARLTAEESNRVKSQFMANMSHELRTPLNAIIGFSELIRDALVGPVAARYKDYAADIHGCGRHLLSLINDVLDISRIEAGRLDLIEQRVELATMVNDCGRLVAERFKAGKVDLATELPPRLPALLGDELRLKQIVLNLLSNAVKFTPAGGRVVIAVSTMVDGGIQLSVSDTGIGIKAQDIPIAFEPFRQLDGALNRRYEGAGLGLPLARTLAELHGGTLNIDSTLGRGTRVTLTLPSYRVLQESQATSPRTSPLTSDVVRGPKLRLVAQQAGPT
jgi:two-component system cell cycle sensor histidine kinase PleC